MNENIDLPRKRPTGAVYIMLSVALILFSGSLIALPLGIAALVFAVRLHKALNAGDEEAFRKNRRSCLILLGIGLFAMIVSGAVGILALLCKYGKITL